MISRTYINSLKTACLIFIGLFFVSCQDTIPARSTISPESAQTTGGTSGGANGETVVSRPDNAIKFKTDFCGCKDKKPVTFGNCSAFCSTKATNGAGILYTNFNVTEDISLNNSLKNVKGWCNNPLPEDTSNPKCVMLAKDEYNNETVLDVETGGSLNSLNINIDKLIEDKTYVLTLVESSSGSKSDSIQIIKYATEISVNSLGPLKIAPITQYTCLKRYATQAANDPDIYFDAAFRMHFYFLPRIPPNPIPPGSNYICHDYMNPLYGAIDDISYPRLAAIQGFISVWDKTDPRFYDNNGNTFLDVNDVIIQKTKNFGATIPPSSKYFFPLKKLIADPAQLANAEMNNNSSTTATGDLVLGYYMYPWIDQSNSHAYCLNNSHYNGSNPLFRAIGEVVGVETEGLYAAKKVPEYVVDPNGTTQTAPEDIIFLKESDLKSTWFYFNNGVPTLPTESMVSNVAVFFYYPFNPTSPYVKASTQSLYQLKSAEEIIQESQNANVSSGGASDSGALSAMPPHDRKFGCVPKF